MSSYKVNNAAFPQIGQAAKSRLLQDFTAIQVDDPRRQEFARSPPERTPKVRRSPPNDRSNSKIDDLVARQDQLLSHQMQVSARQQEIADHLKGQNNALNQQLMKQIVANKDNMIDNLARQQASDWDDRTRELFEQHIRFICAVVEKQNRDIEGILTELHGRDIAVVGTNKAVNKIEVHHVVMLQDLRGRIVRCDTAIAKHSRDILLLMEEIRRLEGALHLTREKLSGDIHRVESELIAMTSELERQGGEQRSDLSHLRSDALHRLNMLEDKQRANMAEFKDALEGNKSNTDHYLERMDAKFKAMIDKATAGWSDLIVQVDQHIDQNLMSILSRLKKLEERQALDGDRLKQMQHNIENQVLATVQESVAYNDAELQRAKQEFRTGLMDVQDSLTNAKYVVDGKRKIMGNQMKKEIGQVKKALYFEMPTQPEGNTYIFRNVDKSNEW